MKKLREVLDKLTVRFAKNQDFLTLSRRRTKKFRELAKREHDRQVRAEALKRPVRAARYQRRAEARQTRAIYWKGRLKEHLSKVEHLEASIEVQEREIEKWRKEHGPYLDGPYKIRGGTPDQRLRLAIRTAALNYRKGTQPGYYSQTGAFRSYGHGLVNYPWGHIWDCSTFADAMYFVCGLDSPSGPDGYRLGGFTGTELAHGRKISRSEARAGDLVIYLDYWGDRTGHHVEVINDPVRGTTVGHGDFAINSGEIDLFGDGMYEIRRYY